MADNLLELTAAIVSSHVENNSVHAGDLPELIKSVHEALARLDRPAPDAPAGPARKEGAVSARKSLADPARIISMIDGKPYATLKRHITRHGYTPDSYREAFGLKADYPMTAPGYSDYRRENAKARGLGRKQVEAAPEPAPDAPKRRGRKPKGDRGAGERAGAPTLLIAMQVPAGSGRTAFWMILVESGTSASWPQSRQTLVRSCGQARRLNASRWCDAAYLLASG